jgi:hypothetical protein
MAALSPTKTIRFDSTATAPSRIGSEDTGSTQAAKYIFIFEALKLGAAHLRA